MTEIVQPPAGFHDLLNNPSAAENAFAQFVSDWGTTSWVAAVGGALLGLLVLAKNWPGLYGTVASVAHKVLAPHLSKQQRQQQEKAAESAQQMVLAIQDWREEIEEVSKDPILKELMRKVDIDPETVIKSLTKRIDAYTPPEFNAFVDELRKERARLLSEKRYLPADPSVMTRVPKALRVKPPENPQ